MNYKDKLDASQVHAHNQNIATKILRDLNKLRSTVEESQSNSRRWIWELIQNARDVSTEEGVIIQLRKDSDNNFSFSHTGKPFKPDNIRFLVEQISTKDQENEDESGKRIATGKFGTGFLTTHLLSEKVTVNGVLKDDGLPYKRFEVELDRSGYSNSDIIKSVEKSRTVLSKVDELPDVEDYNENDFNTVFTYPITDQTGDQVFKYGIQDLTKSIGYVLCLNTEIREILVGSNGNKFYKEDVEIKITEDGAIYKIVRIWKGVKTNLYYAVFSSGYTSIIVPISKNNDNFKILELDDEVPSLFCQFPLVGSTSFKFPGIINNPNFNPTEPRDGLHLTITQRENKLSSENRVYIQDAITLYEKFARFAMLNRWGNLHLLAKIKTDTNYQNWLSKDFYEKNVVAGVRRIIRQKNIVLSSSGELIPLFNQYNNPYAKIPRGSGKKLRNRLWKIGTTIYPYLLPIEGHLDFWASYSWDKCEKYNSISICKFIEECGDIKQLKGKIHAESIYAWLNHVYKVLQQDEYAIDRIINNYKIFPDQNGNFSKWNDLKYQENEIEEIFKDILRELDLDIRGTILDRKIEVEGLDQNTIDENEVIRLINSITNEKTVDRDVAKRYRSGFNLILKYFRENEKDARTKFPSLYKNKYLLFDEEEMIANVEIVEELNLILEEYNLQNMEDIKTALAQVNIQSASSFELLPVTSQIISNLGIENLEEWKEAMKDKNLAKLFDHNSVPTTDMFIAAATFIKTAKEAIFNHLKSLIDYDLTDAEFTSTTVLGGVKKGGSEIDIVCRPAYNNEVIIYYQAEKDVLDFEESELWIHSSQGVKRISLGHILKKAEIKKFPV